MEGRGFSIKDRPWWDKLLDVLYVPYCSGCQEIGIYGLCSECSQGVKPIHESLYGSFSVYAAGRYEGAWRQTILDCKFKNLTYLTWFLTKNLLKALPSEILEREAVLCVPMPGDLSRINRRGFSLPDLLAKELCRQVEHWSYQSELVWQNRSLAEQKMLSRHERFLNVQGSYTSCLLRGERIFLVDDVLTTGATALEVAKTLVLAGASEVIVGVLALARRD